MQEDALKKDGCKEVFTDVVSGVKANRPGLEEAFKNNLRTSTHISNRITDTAAFRYIYFIYPLTNN